MVSAIKRIEQKERYLLIVAEGGTRTSLLQVAAGTKELAAAVEASKCSRVIFDYRDVIFDVPISDAFNVTRQYEQFPVFSRIKAASVINAQTLGIAKPWLEFSTRRGFNFKYFLSMEEAENWVLEDL